MELATEEASVKLQLSHGHSQKKQQPESKEEATYKIRPNFRQKFRKTVVQNIIHEVLYETLQEVDYSGEDAPNLCQEIVNDIKSRLREMEYHRYKFIIQCVIGEQKGEAVKMACRCFWDSDTDNFAQDVFTNKTMFCVTAAFGVYFY